MNRAPLFRAGTRHPVRTVSGLAVVVALASCAPAKGPAGPPDSYLVVERAATDAKAIATGLPALKPLEVGDVRAVPVHRGAADGFLGEMLRTDYLAKAVIRNGWQGRPFSQRAQARAADATVLVLAGARSTRTEEALMGTGFVQPGSFGRERRHEDATWIEVGEDPASDPAFVQTVSGRVARLVAERIADAVVPSTPTPPPRALIDGYALAMEVIGREWRVGEGPLGRVAPDAGTGTQRERFAAVRQNSFVFGPDGHSLRPAAEMVQDPGIVAAVIYRMAQSKGVGRKIAPTEIYAPIVKEHVPPGVSPAAVLGPVRNFQLKLLTSWAQASLAGRPPRDLVDLVTAYAEMLPQERNEVIRLFVITTFGATVKAGGVSAAAADSTASMAELTALAVEVVAGRRTLRDGMKP